MSVYRTICARFTQAFNRLGEANPRWKEAAALVTSAAATGGLSFWYGAGVAASSAISALTTWGLWNIVSEKKGAVQAAFPILAPARERSEEEAQALVAIYEKIFGADRLRFEGTVFAQANQISAWMNENRETLRGYTRLDLIRLDLRVLPPEIGLFENLQILQLLRNRLEVLPEALWSLRNLRTLNLSQNRLRAIPEALRNLQHLQEFYIAKNRIEVLPEALWSLRNLRCLSLANNRLQAISEALGNLQDLQALFLQSNQLEAFPQSVVLLPATCRVQAELNRFTPAYAQTFLETLRRHQAANPLEGPHVLFSIDDAPAAAAVERIRTVEQEAAEWEREFIDAFPEQRAATGGLDLLTNPLNQPQKDQLQLYLGSIRRISDYQNGGERKKNVIRIVNQAMQLAKRNEEFRTAFTSIIHEGTESCGDRVHIILNEIEILNLVYGKERSDEEFSRLAVRLGRYQLLKDHAVKAAEEHRLGDQIETILYYLLMLREGLDLPTTTVGMLYEGMAGVNPEMLQKAATEIGGASSLKCLAASDYWLTRMKRKDPERAHQINELYRDLLEKAEEIDYKADLLKIEEGPLRRLFQEAKEKGYECRSYADAARLIEQKRREVLANGEIASAAAGVV